MCAASCLFQLVRCSVCRIAILSISASVWCGGTENSGLPARLVANRLGQVGRAAPRCPSATSTARSIAFSSSRTLPGQRLRISR